MGTDSPQALLSAVFFYNGLNFILPGEEHRQLKISQLKFCTVSDPDDPSKEIECVKYTEHGSKNRPGGSHQLNLDNKVVVQYAQPERGERCHVFLLRLYLSKLPECAVKEDIFYWRPRPGIPSNSEPWFFKNAIGHNVLAQLMKRMLTSSGIDSTGKSNHSLRATAISRMFQSNVPQKVIKKRSGHLTKEGLASYEWTTAQQQKAVCKVLNDANCRVQDESKPPANCPKSCNQDQTPQVQDVQAVEEIPESELMKKLQFHGMQGCTFNINVNL